ncbi:MAG: SpaA isopeptide-forming pilin-related protein [Patescibacteria group bacterium]
MTYLFKSNWHMPNLIIKKSTKRRALKTINVISTLAIILNTGLVSAFINPTAASAADTVLNSPSENIENASGDSWNNASSAYANGGVAATDSSGERHRYYNFNFSIPNASSIDGISVKADAWSSDSSGCQLGVDLSWNSGSSWSNEKTQNLSGNEATYTLGGSSDKWGSHTWQPSEFSNANFRVRVRDIDPGQNCQDSATTSLDWLQAQIHYTEASVTPTPVANPALAQTCGLDIGLVVDTSGSVSTSEMTQMKTALTNFTNAFVGTPTVFSLSSFALESVVEKNFSRTPAQMAADISTDIPADGDGSTNWDGGLARGFSTFDPRADKANLIVIATDGSPNHYGYPDAVPSGPDLWEEALNKAIERANAIKTAGTRIVVVGIGDDSSDPSTPAQKLDKMKAISGPNVATVPANITTSTDVIKVTNFDDIGAALSAYVKQLCGGKILVQKQFENDPNASLAGYTFDVDGSPSNPAAQVTTATGSLAFNDMLNGTYSVTETVVQPNTTLASATCVNGNSPVGTLDLNGRTISGLAMGTDDTISCTFVNKLLPPPDGTLKVNKQFDDNGDGQVDRTNPQGWTWDITSGDQNIAGGTTKTLTAGSYGVSEDAIANYTATWSCNNQTSGTGTNFNVTVVANQAVQCAFLNTRNTGRIVFDKVVVGGSALDSAFTFTVNAQNYKDGDAATFLTGSYPLTEGAVTGYTLTGASGACSLGQNGVTLNVTTQGGTCTITNTRDTGTLIVHKDVLNPDGGAVADTHNFSVLLNAGNQKTIAEGTDATYNNLDTGTYTIVENADGDYTFVSYSADGDANVAGAQVTVTKGQTTHLTVTNKQKKATITIYKNVLNAAGNEVSDATAFTVQRTGGSNGSIAEGAPWAVQVNPGTYTFTEVANSNYTTTSTNPKQLTVGSNGTAEYTFVNKQKSSGISGKKFEDENGNGVRNNGDDGMDDWKIYLDLNNNDQWDNGEPYDWTDNNGYYSFSNLNAGTYTVREVQQNGWLQTAPQGGEWTIQLAVNQEVSGKDFGNFQLGKIWGYKYEDKDGDGNVDQSDVKKDGWTICLNGPLQKCVVTGENTQDHNWPDGYYEFTGLTAGNYTVTEQRATGWYVVAPQLTGYNVAIDSGDVEQKNFFNFKGFDLTVKKLIDGDASLQTTGDQTPGQNWEIQLWKNGQPCTVQTCGDFTKYTDQNGTATWTNLPYGEYEVKEIFNGNEWQALLSDNITVPNWSDDDSSKTVGEFDAMSGTNVEVTFINWKRAPVKIAGYKIVCENESYLPDWAYHNAPGSITASTAQNFVNSVNAQYEHNVCELVPDWNFQWGFSDQVGNPGDNTPEAAANWHTFAANGTPVTIDAFTGTKNLRVREVWNDLHIPFDGTINPKSVKIGAEFYCGTDIKNFDNYEYVDGVQYGLNGSQPTYYCVAFNVRQTGTVTVHKNFDDNGDGEIDRVNPEEWTWDVVDGQQNNVGSATLTLPTGNYSLSEDVIAGYSTTWSCTNETTGQGTVIPVAVGYNQNVTCTFTNTLPKLTITKTANPAVVNGNQDVTYTVIWSVAGAKATDVVVTDPIPANTSFVSMSCTGTVGTCTTSTTGTPVSSVSWNLGTRNPGENGTLVLVVKTAVSVPNGSVIPNIANIKSAEVDPVFAQADVKAATAPVLQITKTGSATIVNPGDPLTYTVKVKNVGTDTAVNAVATDTLPAGFSFVSTSPVANSIVGQTATWNLGNMIVGQEVTLTYTVNVAPGTTAGVYDNIAKAKADNAPEVSTKVPVTTRVPQVLGETTSPVLEISKSVNKKAVTPGTVVTYTVKVKNSGTGSAINVVLQDILPLGFTFDGTSNTSQSWNLGNIAVGETKTVSYKVKVGSSVPNGAYENLALATADNHGKVTATAPVQVKRGRVLGATVDTGAGIADYAIAASGLGLIILGYVITRRKNGNITA